jgi:hypothetical protein
MYFLLLLLKNKMHYVVANTFIQYYQTSFLGFFQKTHFEIDYNEFAHLFDSDKTIKLFESYDDAYEFTSSQVHYDDFDGLLNECWTTSIQPIHEVVLVKDYQLDLYPLHAQNKPYYREIPGSLVLHTQSIFAGGQNINHLLNVNFPEKSSNASCEP